MIFIILIVACGIDGMISLTRATTTNTSCYSQMDPLSCYLQNEIDIQVSPPAYCGDLGTFHFCMIELDCFRISIEQIQAHYLASTSMMIGSYNMGAECFGRWNLSTPNFIHEKGTVDMNASNANIEITMEITKSQSTPYQDLPVAMQFSECVTKDIKVDAKFTGMSKIFDSVVQSGLEHFIPPAVDFFVCDELANFVHTNGSTYLMETFDPKMVSLINSPSNVPVVYDDVVNWSESNFVHFVDNLVNLLNEILMSPSSTMMEPQTVLLNSYPSITFDDVLVVDVDNVISLDTSDVTSVPLMLRVEQIELKGLNTLSDLLFLSPNAISNSSLDFGCKFEFLDAQVFFSTWFENSIHRRNYTMVVSLSNFDFLSTIDFAISKSDLDILYIDQLMNKNCFLSTVDRLNVSSIDLVTHKDEATRGLKMEHLELLSDISDDVETLEYDLVALMNQTLLLATSGFQEFTSDIFGGVLQGPLRHSINEQIQTMMNNISDCADHVDTSDHEEYVVFCNSSVISKINQLIDDTLGAQGVNLFMFKAGNEATFNIFGSNVTIRGLDSFGTLDILYPYCDVDPNAFRSQEIFYLLGNKILMGKCDADMDGGMIPDIHCRPLEIQIDFNIDQSSDMFSSQLLSFLPGLSQSSSPSSLVLNFRNLYIFADVLAKYDINKLKNLRVGELCVSCLIAAMDHLEVHDLVINATQVSVFSSNEKFNGDMTDEFNEFTSQFGEWGVLNIALANILSMSKQLCKEGPDPIPTTDDVLHGLTLDMKIIIIVASLIATIVFYIVYYHHGLEEDVVKVQTHHNATHKSSHSVHAYRDYLMNCRSNSISTLQDSVVESPMYLPPELPSSTSTNVIAATVKSSVDLRATPSQQEPQHVNQEKEEAIKPSLCYDQRISIYYRILMPCLCVACFGLFLWSNNDDGATVNLDVHIGNGELGPYALFTFGLGNTVQDMWDAEVYLLAILIAFFSGFWPYLKIAVMFLAWTLPVRQFSEETRNIWLIVMDVLGKWSLIDTFVLTLMMVAFYFEMFIGSSIQVYVTVYPEVGFYTFLLGTIMSLVIGHVTLHEHRIAMKPLEMSSDQATRKPKLVNEEVEAYSDNCMNEKIASMNHLYHISSEIGEYLGSEKVARRDGDVVKPDYYVAVTLLGKVAMVLLVGINLLLLSLGVIAYSFQFEFKGLTGLLLGDSSTVPYSFYGIGVGLPAASGNVSDPAPYVIQFFYFIYGFAVPVTVCLVIIAVWVFPLSYKTLKKALIGLEILHAWSALDVFCLSVFAANLEISQFATFIVGDNCDEINKILAAKLDTQLDGDDVCFDLIATLKWDAWMIFTAAFMSFVVTSSFLAILRAVIHDQATRLQLSTKFVSTRSISESLSCRASSVHKVENNLVLDSSLHLGTHEIYSSLLNADTNTGIHDSWHNSTTNDSIHLDHKKNVIDDKNSIDEPLSLRISKRFLTVINTIFLQICLVGQMIQVVKIYPQYEEGD